MAHKSPKDYLIFPLDVEDGDAAVRLVRELKHVVGVFKVGLELFVREGPSILARVRSEAGEAKLFLDLKFHDIPATVRGAYRSAVTHRVDFVTVHCDEGEGLVKALASESPGETRILAVTVLTSLDPHDMVRLGYRREYEQDLGELVLLRARLAHEAGCAGVVCSGLEAARVKRELGESFLVVAPGIRPRWSMVHGEDQKRVATPGAVIQNGADYIVVGRPIRDAEDRAEAARRVLDEIEEALQTCPHCAGTGLVCGHAPPPPEEACCSDFANAVCPHCLGTGKRPNPCAPKSP